MNTITLEQMRKELPQAVLDIANVLSQNNYKAYLVGGSVRDLLLGKAIHDFDIATDALPDTIVNLFPKSIEVGAKFGTVIVVSSKDGLDDKDGEEEQYQVTTFRKDAQYIKGRWPEKVTFSKTIEEDLARRDFTINALAIDLEHLPETGNIQESIIDPFHGIEALNTGSIQAVRDPYERMSEDGLRAIRGCRLAAQLEFRIEDTTFEAIKAAASTITQLSKERVRDELLKIMDTAYPSIALELMRRTGILSIFIPELIEGVGIEQNEFHVHDIYTHLLKTCDLAPKKIRIAALFHDIGKSRTKNDGHFYGHEEVGAVMTREILERLKFPKVYITYVEKLVRLHMFYYTPDWGDGAVRRFLAKVGSEEMLQDLFLLRLADASSNPKSDFDPENLRELEKRIMKIRNEDNALSLKDLHINGNDLKALGITDGKEIGRILDALLERVLDDPRLNEKQKLESIIKLEFLH